MKCNKHQQQITNKLIICITETKTKSSMYRALHVTKSEANKILEFFAFDSANYSFYLLCIMASFLMKKVFFIFLTAFSINFEHKNFKGLIML